MRRRHFLVGLGLALAPCLTGCNHGFSLVGNKDRPTPPTAGKTPTAEELVAYLNYNARKVQAVQSNRVEIDCKQGNQGIGLDGLMVCQKPRNFRLKARVVGQPAVDIGSNEQEFWYWISKNEPPYVYHCSYEELARGVRLQFPFQPDMIVAALGMAEYDPNKKYEVKPNDKTIELIEQAVSPQGQPIKKITVFNMFQAKAGQPQVLAYKLKDMQDRDICTAVVYEVQSVQVAGYPEPAVMPYRLKLSWPDQKIEMTMWLKDLQSVNIGPEQAARMFNRRDVGGDLQGFDLARGTPDTPGGVGQMQSRTRGVQPARFP
jgi:hypothetical protein